MERLITPEQGEMAPVNRLAQYALPAPARVPAAPPQIPPARAQVSPLGNLVRWTLRVAILIPLVACALMLLLSVLVPGLFAGLLLGIVALTPLLVVGVGVLLTEGVHSSVMPH